MRLSEEEDYGDHHQKVAISWWNVRPVILVLATSVVLSLVALLGFTAGVSFSDYNGLEFFSNTITAWSEPETLKGGDGGLGPPPPLPEDYGSGTFRLLSKSMYDGGNLPYAYTCMAEDGVGTSPPFYWENAPANTKQFFLMMETDAYKHDGTYLYTRDDWTIYNIPAETTSIEAGNIGSVGIRGGTYPGTEMHIYNPPCPFGSGNKTYFFTIYAVSDDLGSTICPSGTYTDTTTTPNTLRCNTDSTDEIGINMASLADTMGIVVGSASMTTSFCMYSDAQASCTMGNYLRHQVQRPAGAAKGDIFEPELGGKEQKMAGSSLAQEVYTKSLFHLSAAAQQGQIVDDDAEIPKNARIKKEKMIASTKTTSTTSDAAIKSSKKDDNIIKTDKTLEATTRGKPMMSSGKADVVEEAKESSSKKDKKSSSSKSSSSSKKDSRDGKKSDSDDTKKSNSPHKSQKSSK